MQQKIIEQKNDLNLVEVTNYTQQSVNSILTPNIMFLNRPIKVKNQMVYRLIVWFDIQNLNDKLIVTKDLNFENFEFNLNITKNNELIKLKSENVQKNFELKLSYDEQNHPMIDDENNYFVYLIDEKNLDDHQVNLIYDLSFTNANYQEFLNDEKTGFNRGKIKINLQSEIINKTITIPEIIVYLFNDTWIHQQKVNYVILKKDYKLTSYDINYLNKSQLPIFKIQLNVIKNLPLAITSLTYLNNIVYEYQNNFITSDILFENVELTSKSKLNDFYEEKLLFETKNIFNGQELILTSKWIYNPDLNKSVKSNTNYLIFNPMVKEEQLLKVSFSLENKKYEQVISFNQTPSNLLDNRARKTTYYLEKTYKFNLSDELTFKVFEDYNNENK